MTAPVTPAEFAAALLPLLGPAPRGIVVAVSGGPDSMALLHLAAACRSDLPPLAVATVDHGLRADASRDVEAVLAQARALGLPAHGLRWTGPKPARAIQERARSARYALLDALCRTLDASHLLTGHTLDDQAETVLFRMARGSGVGGLAGMAPCVERAGLVHARPLLGFAKARLVATCKAAGLPVLTDPSNRDPRFARARWRGLMPGLAAEGLDAARLARLAERAARAEAALVRAAGQLEAKVVRNAGGGSETLDLGRLASEPVELALRIVGAAVQRVGGGTLRLDRLERLAGDLLEAVARAVPLRRTLGGTTVSLSRDGLVEVAREPPRRRGVREPAARGREAGLAITVAPPLQGNGGRLH